jgi:hypothetical protein
VLHQATQLTAIAAVSTVIATAPQLQSYAADALGIASLLRKRQQHTLSITQTKRIAT